MAEYTKRQLLYLRADVTGGNGLAVADQLGLIAGYEKLLAERDALARRTAGGSSEACRRDVRSRDGCSTGTGE